MPVSPGYCLSLFSFQPLVISAAICLYLKMFTSHLPTPSDPSIKPLCCICVITTVSQLGFYWQIEQKAPRWLEEGALLHIPCPSGDTVFPYMEKGVRFKYQPLSLPISWTPSSDACEKRCRTCNWESKMRGKNPKPWREVVKVRRSHGMVLLQLGKKMISNTKISYCNTKAIGVPPESAFIFFLSSRISQQGSPSLSPVFKIRIFQYSSYTSTFIYICFC